MKKHLTILIFPLALMILFVGCFSYILFMIKVNSEKIATLEREQLAREVASASVKDLELEVKKANEELVGVKSIWIDDKDTPSLLSSIEELSDFTDTEINILNIVDNSDKEGGLSILLSAEGSFENVFRTIRLLENLPYATSFSRVSISRVPDSENWVADLDFSILSFKSE